MVDMQGAKAQQAVVLTDTVTKSYPFAGPDAPAVFVQSAEIDVGDAAPTGAADGDWVICTHADRIADKKTRYIVISSLCQYFVDA